MNCPYRENTMSATTTRIFGGIIALLVILNALVFFRGCENNTEERVVTTTATDETKELKEQNAKLQNQLTEVIQAMKEVKTLPAPVIHIPKPEPTVLERLFGNLIDHGGTISKDKIDLGCGGKKNISPPEAKIEVDLEKLKEQRKALLSEEVSLSQKVRQPRSWREHSDSWEGLKKVQNKIRNIDEKIRSTEAEID
jgi:hypothetical protein